MRSIYGNFKHKQSPIQAVFILFWFSETFFAVAVHDWKRKYVFKNTRSMPETQSFDNLET